MNFDPHIAGLVVLTTSVGGLMMLAGLGKHALARRRRMCPSCGRLVVGRCYACR
jgi:uncharacterized protein (TIGR03382 family)